MSITLTTPPASPTPPHSMLGHYAGFASRLLAFILDVTLLSITIVATSWFFSTTIAMLQGWVILESLASRYAFVDQILKIVHSPVLYSGVSILFIISYYLFFWTTTGQTPGKYIMGLRILSPTGKKLKFRQAVLRYVGYYISAFAFGLGFLWILVDDERRGWHDRLAHTLVVYVWDARPDENFLVRVYSDLRRRQEILRKMVSRRKIQKG